MLGLLKQATTVAPRGMLNYFARLRAATATLRLSACRNALLARDWSYV
jgi:hypothetical protein